MGDEWAPWSRLNPGEWCPAPEFYSAAGWAFARCPNGHYGTIGQTHVLNPESELLEPSYVCPQDGCGFHDYVVLNQSRYRPELPRTVLS